MCIERVLVRKLTQGTAFITDFNTEISFRNEIRVLESVIKIACWVMGVQLC